MNLQFASYLNLFYQHPEPEKAPAMLRELINSDFYQSKRAYQDDAVGITAYMFGRIGSLYPDVKNGYRQVYEETNEQGRLFILNLYQYCLSGDDFEYLSKTAKEHRTNEEQKAMERLSEKKQPGLDLSKRDIEKSSELDYYWSEFFITGNIEPVRKILNVMQWPDRTRIKLADFLKGAASEKEKEKISATLKPFDIQIEGNEILSQQDLDISISEGIMLKNLGQIFQEIKKQIPYTDEDITYFATKGVASWAMNSNAGQHEKIQRFLESQIPTLNGSGLLAALIFSAEAELDRNEDRAALNNIQKYLNLNPQNARAHQFLMLYYMKQGDQEGVIKQIKILDTLDPDLAREIRNNLKLQQ